MRPKMIETGASVVIALSTVVVAAVFVAREFHHRLLKEARVEKPCTWTAGKSTWMRDSGGVPLRRRSD